MTWNAGKIDPVSTPILSQEILLENNSLESVKIEDVQTDCGCLAVAGTPTIVMPSEKVALVLDYTVGMVPGPIERSAIINVDIGNKRSLAAFQMIGEVKPVSLLKSEPKKIDFGTLDESNSHRSVLFHVSRFDGSDVSPTRVTVTPKDALQCQFRRLRDSVLVTAIASNHGSTGLLKGEITLHTTHATYPEIQIPFRIFRRNSQKNSSRVESNARPLVVYVGRQ